ncbi:3-beta-hydroxysteroid dehydrogenase [Paraphoma chrysanthemicola]|uniref:3-beta-hydroxysteroid dehydrogenase n=1 Tax=Paraphoma chrysanthemicola TaxID=798071 RepID=A0A8K0R4H0_9PLEO|nr:3-beta-hydroxysteroid dehydrogenase [Paraphoma chrysanthemicola]
MSRVALITGGGSGMGLEVARLLAGTKAWSIHLIDVNEKAGKNAVQLLGDNVATFHHVDVTNYDLLGKAFQAAFEAKGRLDFVYANAGIIDRGEIYATSDQVQYPPELNHIAIDINLKSVINSSYLAAHYFRLSPHGGKDADLVITASVASLYPVESSPIYVAGKFGALGFMWSIAETFRARWGIRVNAVLPAPVATNFAPKETWEHFDQKLLTPVTQVASVVTQFLEHKAMRDAKGVEHAADQVYGLAAEVITKDFFFREVPRYCNETMEKAMDKAVVDR